MHESLYSYTTRDLPVLGLRPCISVRALSLIATQQGLYIGGPLDFIRKHRSDSLANSLFFKLVPIRSNRVCAGENIDLQRNKPL